MLDSTIFSGAPVTVAAAVSAGRLAPVPTKAAENWSTPILAGNHPRCLIAQFPWRLRCPSGGGLAADPPLDLATLGLGFVCDIAYSW